MRIIGSDTITSERILMNMTNIEKYDRAFMDAFGIGAEVLPNLEFQGIPEWDSVGHMTLISSLEEAFGFMFEPNDIIDLSSYALGKEIIAKYSVVL